MDMYDNKKIKPMLLNESKCAFNDKNYIFELKYDGIRALIYVSSNEITIINRRGRDNTYLYPELNKLKTLVKHKCIFDGEIVSLVDGKPSFEKLQERAFLKHKNKIDFLSKNNPVTFICYDLIYDEKDITELSLMERKKLLDKYEDTEYFVKTRFIEESGIKLFEAIKKENLEGMVAKHKNSKYLINKRSAYWIKIKNLLDEDFIICGYKEKAENSSVSILLGRKEENKIIYVGKVVIGKKRLDYKSIKNMKTINKSPFFKYSIPGYTYIEPKLICTVTYTEKTSNNSIRHPVYKCLKNQIY